MAELPEDWQNVPNEQEKSEEIKRLTVRLHALTSALNRVATVQPCLRSVYPPHATEFDYQKLHALHETILPVTQVPENLSDIERATTLLSGGYPQQQKSVIDRYVAFGVSVCTAKALDASHGLTRLHLQLASTCPLKRQGCFSCRWQPSLCPPSYF